MASTYFAGVTLMLILLLSDHSVRGRAAPMNTGLVPNNQNIPVSSRSHNNVTMESIPPSPRNSHDEIKLGANQITHWAGLQSKGNHDNVLASLNVFRVPVKPNQISSASVTLSIGTNGPPEQLEAIQFGWHVWPEKYKDFDAHFFVSWTKDGYQNTGCFNLDCKGFVFDNQSQYRPGNVLKPVSEPNGTRYSISAMIVKEPTNKWYLYHGSEWDKPIGYWPVELFDKLQDYGTRVDVGGIVQFTRGEPGPPMGSGFLPSDAGKAAFIRAQYIDMGDTLTLEGSINVDKEGYYSMARSNNDYYYFGGPGGCVD